MNSLLSIFIITIIMYNFYLADDSYNNMEKEENRDHML